MEWNGLSGLDSRYLSPEILDQALQRLKGWNEQFSLGRSNQNRPIEVLIYGHGPIRVLLWSQMHGNETTTTRALLDWMKAISDRRPDCVPVLERCTLAVVPMLNPDGARAYTRENAKGVDLNRDALHRSQPEIAHFLEFALGFGPQYAFNLHDQRTFYGLEGESPKPATVSFLAPAVDPVLSVPPHREEAMGLVCSMAERLQKEIPGQVGRYDDTHNPNCLGDHFQASGISTVLLEAGHFPGDYQRHKTRRLVFHALQAGLIQCAMGKSRKTPQDYEYIPQNRKLYCDLRVDNAQILLGERAAAGPRFVQYKEVFDGVSVRLVPDLFAEDWMPVAAHHSMNLADDKDLERIRKDEELLRLIEKTA